MSITTVPIEILEEITQWINDIYDLENWLICVYKLEDLQSTQRKRNQLTQGKECEENRRKTELLFNRKFAGEKEKRRKLHGVFNNYLLVDQREKKERCMDRWLNIATDKEFESFIAEYHEVWVNRAPSKKKRTWKGNKKGQEARNKIVLKQKKRK